MRTSEAPRPVRRLSVVQVRIDPDRAMPSLLGVIIALSVINFLAQFLLLGLGMDPPGVSTALRFFDVDTRGRIPAWFQVGMLLVAGLAMITLGDDERVDEGRWARQWTALGVAVCVLSLDEAVGVHEIVGTRLHDLVGYGLPFYGTWAAIAVPIVAGFVVGCRRLALAMPRPVLTTLLVAFACYGVGELGMEIVGEKIAAVVGTDNLLYGSCAAIGEGLAMLGQALLIVGIGQYARLPRRPPAPAAVRSGEPRPDLAGQPAFRRKDAGRKGDRPEYPRLTESDHGGLAERTVGRPDQAPG